MDQMDLLFVCAEELRACRVCLATETKLFDLHSNNLDDIFCDLTRIPVLITDGLPQHICSMCSTLLRKAAAFKAKCIKTYAFLQSCLQLQPITMDYIRSLDRTHLDLPFTTTISTQDYPSDDVEDCILNDIIKQESKFEFELVPEETLDLDTHESVDEILNESETCEFKDDGINDDINTHSGKVDKSLKRRLKTATVKKESPITRAKSRKVNHKTTKHDKDTKPEVFVEVNIEKTDNSDSDDEKLITMVTRKLKKSKNTDPEKQKLKYYLIDSKNGTRDNFKKSFYDYILSKYIDNTCNIKKKEKKIDILGLDNEDLIKTEEEITEETCNEFISSKSTSDTQKMFYNYIKEKYINKKRPEDIKNVVNINKFKVKLKRKKRGTTQEDFDKFAKTYNFEIINMSKEEQIKELQARKETVKYKNSKFQCDECCRGFSSETVFKNHMVIHDPSNGAHVCEICRVRFKDRKRMLAHLRNHTIKFVCKTCRRHFWNSSMAKNHFKTHEGVTFDCEHCGKSFSKYATRLNHIRIHHGNTTCDICYATLQGPAALMVHKTKLHKQIFPCSTCSLNFDNLDALKIHVSPDNVCDPRMRPCTKCGETFASEELLKNHIKQGHKKPKPVVRGTKYGRKRKPCCPCTSEERGAPETGAVSTERTHHHTYDDGFDRNWPFGYPGHMEREIPHGDLQRSRIEEDKTDHRIGNAAKRGCPCVGTDLERNCPCSDERKRPKVKSTFMCEMCALTFNSKASLRYHQLIHTGEKPHQCTYCEKRFRIKESLEQHLRTHTGDRPYKCSHCDKAFPVLTNLYRHQLVHTRERRHRCTLCDKMYQTTTVLKLHIRTVHMKIPTKPRVRNRKMKLE